MKKLIVIGICAVVAFASNADVLYWMVGDDWGNRPQDAVQAESASLYAMYNGVTQTPALDTQDSTAIADAIDWGEPFEVSLGSYAGNGWSYYVEYSNGIKTDPVTYQNAVNNGYIVQGGSVGLPNISTQGLGGGSTTYNVPEPTSGLLFLVGGMLLGLKRRRMA